MILKGWNKLSRLGITPEDSYDSIRRKVFFNRVVLIMALPGIPYFFIFILLGLKALVFSVLFFVSFYYIALFLNFRGHPEHAKLLLVVATSCAVFTFSNLIGPQCGIQWIAFGLSAMNLILFSAKNQTKAVFAFFTPVSFFFISEITNYHLLNFSYNFPHIIVRGLFFTSISVVIAIIYLSIRFYINLNIEAESHLEKSNLQLLESNINLKNSNDQLQIAMENLTESHKLQATMKSQTEFASLTRQIAHEIKNPMHMIRGNAEIVVDLRADQSEKIKPCLGAVVEAIDRIEKIIDAMMRYGDSQKGFSPEIVSAKRLLEGIGQLAMGNCKNKLITLEINCPDDLTFFSDDKRIGQALINLISNSLQYTPAKGKISLAASPATYKSPREPHELLDGVCLYVTDTGCGIPADKIEAIFSPSITSNNAEHNFGLGLAIVFQTMTESNGLVKVDSEVGKGTSFMLYLPSKPYKIEGQHDMSQQQAWFAKQPETQEIYELPPGMFGKQVKLK